MKPEPDLTTLQVSLPRSQCAFVEAAAMRAGCTTPSEYVSRLIHAAQSREDQEQLERLALEGLRSGAPIELTPEFWEDLRRDVLGAPTQPKTL